jgi:hypothetical protein
LNSHGISTEDPGKDIRQQNYENCLEVERLKEEAAKLKAAGDKAAADKLEKEMAEAKAKE